MPPEMGYYEMTLNIQTKSTNQTTGENIFNYETKKIDTALCGINGFNYSNQDEIVFKGINQY